MNEYLVGAPRRCDVSPQFLSLGMILTWPPDHLYLTAMDVLADDIANEGERVNLRPAIAGIFGPPQQRGGF